MAFLLRKMQPERPRGAEVYGTSTILLCVYIYSCICIYIYNIYTVYIYIHIMGGKQIYGHFWGISLIIVHEFWICNISWPNLTPSPQHRVQQGKDGCVSKFGISSNLSKTASVADSILVLPNFMRWYPNQVYTTCPQTLMLQIKNIQEPKVQFLQIDKLVIGRKLFRAV